MRKKLKDNKKSLLMRREKNHRWKGNKVGYISLHEWIESRKPKPEFCERCKKKKPYDLANISGKYKRDINDFEWLCRGCHMKEDGRLKKGNESRMRKKKGKLLQCVICKLFQVKENFTKDKSSFDGFDHKCRKCKSKAYREYNKNRKNKNGR